MRILETALRSRTIQLAFVVVVAGSAVRGQDRIADRFKSYDRDSDGRVTPAELPNTRLFRKLDSDGDGGITLAETRDAVARGVLTSTGTTAPEPAAPPEEDSDSSADIRQGPLILRPGEQRIGTQVPDLSFTDMTGKAHRLSDFQKRSATVVLMTGTGCPLCLKYAPTLAQLEQKYRDRGVAFLFVNPNESESVEAINTAITQHGFDGPYLRDSDLKLPAALGARTTTEAFVLDRTRTLVYRGAVDDQYGFGYANDAPRKTYLSDALDAVLADGKPPVPATSSPGCDLFYGDTERPTEPAITYHNRVSRIIQANCIDCHRADGIGPMPLETFPQVRDYAAMIRSVVQRKVMPPWFAADHTSDDSGPTRAHWSNDRSLSDLERDDLFAWIKAGAPEGNPEDAPLPRAFPDGWLIGQPDAVFEFAEPVPVKATGTMPYRYVTVDTNLPEDRWVQAIEVRPGNIGVVHHVIVSLRGDRGDGRDGYWGVYVPGNSTLVYPDGFAKRLPKGAQLRFQMHYTPNGTATTDSTRIGVIFARQPPKHEVRVRGIANTKIRIPPGAPNHPETAQHVLEDDIQILGFLPHMHLRGKAARYRVETSNGNQTTLLDIPRYDFNWQLLYQLSNPLRLNRGDTIVFDAWFDNSEENPANPDATKTVKWGPQTHHEMHLGYVEYFVPGDTPGESTATRRRSREPADSRESSVREFFQRLDVDGNGLITRDEVRQQLPGNTAAAGPVFDGLDTNGDDKLNEQELSQLRNRRRGT